MVEPNNTSELTSNYVLSPTPQAEVTANGRKATRNHRTWPTITSLRGFSVEGSNVIPDVPPDLSSNPGLPNTCPTNGEVPVDAEPLSRNHQPVFKVNALCIQVLLYPITIVIYLLVGAALFTAIEHDYQNRPAGTANHEMTITDQLESELEHAVGEVLRKFNVSENTSKEFLTTHFCVHQGVHNSDSRIPNQWDFLPSIYFAATIITTIGYGRMSPRTDLGRAFLCIYALMGIPLLLVCLTTIGKYFSGKWDTLVSRIPWKKSHKVDKNKDIYSFGILTILCFVIVVLIPAAIFQKIENHWSYQDAVYFTIVSLTTIGLGDYTPAPQHLVELEYIVLYLIWLFIGFAVVSVLLTKLSAIYMRVNKSVIQLSKGCFNKCMKVKKNDQQPLICENNDSMELST